MEKSEIETLLISNMEYIKNVSFKYTKNLEEAEYLASDVILNVLEKVNFKPQSDASTDFKKYLNIIIRNSYINKYRTKQRQNNVWVDCDPFQLGDKCLLFNSEESDSNINLNQLNKLIVDSNIKTNKGNNRKYKDIDYKIFQAYLNGYKYDEISEMFEININNIKSKIFSFKQRAKQMLLNNYIT